MGSVLSADNRLDNHFIEKPRESVYPTVMLVWSINGLRNTGERAEPRVQRRVKQPAEC